jgi:hypothetical protein
MYTSLMDVPVHATRGKQQALRLQLSLVPALWVHGVGLSATNDSHECSFERESVAFLISIGMA